MTDFIELLGKTIGERETQMTQAEVQARAARHAAHMDRLTKAAAANAYSLAQSEAARQDPVKRLQTETAQYLREGLVSAAQFLVAKGVTPHFKLETCTTETVPYKYLPFLYREAHGHVGTESWIIQNVSSNWFSEGGNPMDSNNGGSRGDSGYGNYLVLLQTDGTLDRVRINRGRRIERPFDTMQVSPDKVWRMSTDDDFLIPRNTVDLDQPIELNPRVVYFLGRVADIAIGNRAPEITAS